MKQEKCGTAAGTGAPSKVWLISDAKLVALHRKLLRAVTGSGRAKKGIDRYVAARIAIGLDLKSADTVIEPAAASLRDAFGAARKNKAMKNRRVVVMWTGREGADWQDALEEARVRSLPVVFVCESEDRLRLSPNGTHGKLSPGHELPCIAVDGHDVVAAYRVAHEAIERARQDRGPTLIQLATYKIGNRAFTDPVADMEHYLRGRGLFKSRTNGVKN